jgi:glutamate dehydrogenase (NAD(P)+)
MGPFDAVNYFFHRAAQVGRLSDSADRRAVGHLPRAARPGAAAPRRRQLEVVYGYRVQHNGARGPYKGGIRYHPDADLDEDAGAGVADDVEDRAGRRPLRWRQGRRAGRPEGLSTAELERVTRRYTDQIGHILGGTRDIPAPDMNTNAQTMSWILDQYGRKHGHTNQIVTGKPVALGGSYGREEATGRGRSSSPTPR